MQFKTQKSDSTFGELFIVLEIIFGVSKVFVVSFKS